MSRQRSSTMPPRRHSRPVTGTLGTIASDALVDMPALFVIGRVAALREHLRWFDDRPLFGRRIVVTRSSEQAGELVDMLEDRGAETIPAPTIRITAAEDSARSIRRSPTPRDSTGSSSRARTPSITSSHDCWRRRPARVEGREALHGRAGDCSEASPLRHPGGPRHRLSIVPRRSWTRSKLPDPSRGHACCSRERDIGRDVLLDGLTKAGAIVTDVVAYRTTLAQGDTGGRDIYRMLLDGRDRCRHVHQRVNRPQLCPDPRRGAGRRSSARQLSSRRSARSPLKRAISWGSRRP